MPNNSVVLRDFQYGSNVSIYCVTDLRPCCTAPGQGEWYDERYFSPVSRRPISSERISRYNNSTIALHMGPSSFSTRLHLCRLPNAANVMQYIYVGIYIQYYYCKRHTRLVFSLAVIISLNTDLNTYVPRIERMVYNATSYTLTCISAGSPATTVIWRRNGVIIDADGDVYYAQFLPHIQCHNKLILTGTSNIAGITCQISNTIGSSLIYPIIGKIMRNQHSTINLVL